MADKDSTPLPVAEQAEDETSPVAAEEIGTRHLAGADGALEAVWLSQSASEPMLIAT